MKSKSNPSDKVALAESASPPTKYALPRWLVEDVILKEWPERKDHPMDATEERDH
jgi:hypothetical protein